MSMLQEYIDVFKFRREQLEQEEIRQEQRRQEEEKIKQEKLKQNNRGLLFMSLFLKLIFN